MKAKIFAAALAAAVIALAGGCAAVTSQTENPPEAEAVILEEGGESGESASEYPQLNPPEKGERVAIMDTSLGEIRLRLFPEYAPKAVENFVTHAQNGYYDGLKFHRVMLGFMIQGGDPLGDGTGGESIWGKGFELETDFHLRHFRGALAMAHSPLPDSNGSQFYIVQNGRISTDIAAQLEELLASQDETLGKDADGNEVYTRDIYPPEVLNEYLANGGAIQLDGDYTVFGQVYGGIDVVDEIAGVPVDDSDPNSPKPLEDVIINSIRILDYE